ncbi:MAG: SDR family NAD(P)-dependent oxidoreductase [Planctomycetes bacterium]|nr:SDR family NAD(P)-dependent oxidoreductase [Planctomycetota bacterium]
MKRALLLGNSDGIGLALTRRLLAAGWQVASLSRRPCPVSGLLAHVLADAGSAEFALRLQELVAAHGPFDACVFLIGRGNDFDVTTFAGEEDVLRVNLLAAITTIRIVVPGMVLAGRGHFVGVSSLADELLLHDCPAYSASKAALSSYLNAIARPLRRRGVAVTNMRLGFVDTKMASARVRPAMVSPERAAAWVERCLITRPVQASRPRRMGVLVRLLHWLQRPGVWLRRCR